MAKSALPDAIRLNAFAIEPELLTIIEDPKHHLYDERVKLPIDENLVKNIMVHGVKIPVLVAKDGDDILVVDGRQRVRAAIEANTRLKKEGAEPVLVRVFIEKGTEADQFGVCILANEMRQDDSVMVKARKAKRLLDMNPDEAAAATVFGVSLAQLRTWLKLLDLAAPVRRAIDDGIISATAAAELSGMSREDQTTALDKLKSEATVGGKVSTKKAKAAKKAAATGETTFERPSLRDLKKVHADVGLDDEDRALLGWVLGLVSAADAGVETFLHCPVAASAAAE